MRELLTHDDVTVLGYYRSILEAEGIASFIRNEFGQTIGRGYAGMFQRQFFLDPVLCVANDEDFEDAIALLGPHYKPPPVDETVRTCHHCNETVPGSFETCWNCETLLKEP